MTPTSPCPCGRQSAQRRPLSWADCCARYVEHFDTVPAPDAASLMRSRYCAYVLARIDYLRATWHASTRPAPWEPEVDARWLGLDVRAHRVVDATHAEVEFVARYRVQGRGARLHERSRFVREDRRWYYVDGDVLAA